MGSRPRGSGTRHHAPSIWGSSVTDPRHPERLTVGDAVELHTKFDGSWCPGFEIAEVRDGEYRVRRSRDKELLPSLTSDEDLRAAPSTRDQVS